MRLCGKCIKNNEGFCEIFKKQLEKSKMGEDKCLDKCKTRIKPPTKAETTKKVKKETKKLNELADDVVQTFARLDSIRKSWGKNKYRCCTCGAETEIGARSEMQGGHYHSRSCYALRYDSKNVHAQCASCNFKQSLGDRGADLIKEKYRLFLIATYGPDVIDYLGEKLNDSTKKNAQFFIEVIEEYIPKNYAIHSCWVDFLREDNRKYLLKEFSHLLDI